MPEDLQGCVAVHDHWAPYLRLDVEHALCNAHLFRELAAVIEFDNEHWAEAMRKLLLDANDVVRQAKQAGLSALRPQQMRAFEKRYWSVVRQGLALRCCRACGTLSSMPMSPRYSDRARPTSSSRANFPEPPYDRACSAVTARIHLRRVYDAPGADDGARVLVDRLWPRGLPRARAKIDLWLNEIAPSGALRRWFGHEPAHWEEFAARYRAELMANPAPLAELARLCRAGPVTLLIASHDAERNNAVVLRDLLHERIKAE